MLDLPAFQVNQNKAFQNPMVEYQIDLVWPSTNNSFLLPLQFTNTPMLLFTFQLEFVDFTVQEIAAIISLSPVLRQEYTL